MTGVPHLTRVAAAVTASLAVGCLTACVQIPDHGAVVEVKQGPPAPPVEVPDFNPRPPQPGAEPSAIVAGFLEAMEATPVQTNKALLFLTKEGQAAWKPQQAVVAYDGHAPPRGRRTVSVRLHGASRVGGGGQWLGRLSPDAEEVTFPMRKEDGEWRIARAPNALVVTRTFYEQAYQDASLYFFDPSGRILVPEVVHVPQGQQLATSLVRDLLLGPRPAQAGVERSFIPAGLTVGLSVVVSPRGLATITLRGPDPAPISRKATRLMLAQLAWTLRQDPTIRTFEVAVDGLQISDASGSSTFKVVGGGFNRYDPADANASQQIYALRGGRLVSGQLNNPTPNTGPFGVTRQGIGAFAVSLDDTQVAATTPTSLLLGPVLGNRSPAPVLIGPGLLRPSWDFARRLWEVQDLPGGADVLYVVHGRHHQLHVPGVSGHDVRRFLVSRDGSRLVAVVRGARSDHLVVSRLLYDTAGRPVGATRARRLTWTVRSGARIRDIGWTSPTRVAVLEQLTRAQADVRILNVDGSTSPSEATPRSVSGQVSGLATSPVGTQHPYAVQQHGLFDLAQSDTNVSQLLTQRLRHLTYAG
ncbi:MAG: LpqB family beta-propeller domain-containing protein [Nocardioides sp.]